MTKLYALFPNIKIKESKVFGDITFKGIALGAHGDIDELSTFIQWEFLDYIEEKFIRRKLEVLRCHLILSAYLKGYDYFKVCEIIISENLNFNFKILNKETRASLTELINNLPQNLDNSDRTITWFIRYLEQPVEDERNRVIGLYNAYGTLPGGFDDILSLSSNDLERNMLVYLINRKQDINKENNEEENYRPSTLPLNYNQILFLEKLYINSLIKYFPEFK